jgi:ketosteroid isomerase-like protein
VRRLQAAPGVDIVQLVADEGTARAAWEATVAPLVHPDVEVIVETGVRGRERAVGLDDWRQVWLDWLEPWERYRTETEDLIDMGDQIVVLFRDYGRQRGMDTEVCLIGGTVYTLRDGKVARIEYYLEDRDEALKAVGLRE